MRPALDRIRSTGLPTDLPAAAEFDSSSSDLAATYGLSLTLTRTIADRFGTDALVALFHAVNEGEPGPGPLSMDADEVTDRFLGNRLGLSRAELIAAFTAEMEKGTDPADPKAQALGKRRQALVDVFTSGDKGIEQSLKQMWTEQGDKLAAQFGYHPKVMEYIAKVDEASKGPA